jgi:hypothetical protein
MSADITILKLNNVLDNRYRIDIIIEYSSSQYARRGPYLLNRLLREVGCNYYSSDV